MQLSGLHRQSIKTACFISVTLMERCMQSRPGAKDWIHRHTGLNSDMITRMEEGHFILKQGEINAEPAKAFKLNNQVALFKISHSLATSKDGLKTINIHDETTRT